MLAEVAQFVCAESIFTVPTLVFFQSLKAKVWKQILILARAAPFECACGNLEQPENVFPLRAVHETVSDSTVTNVLSECRLYNSIYSRDREARVIHIDSCRDVSEQRVPTANVLLD